MTVIIASHAAHLSGRERLTRIQGLSLPSRLRLALSFTPTRGRFLCARENTTDRIRVGSRAGARWQPKKLTTGLLNPARTEFFGAIYRPLRSPSGSTRVHDANQPAHVCCPFTHDHNSFRDAPASELQEITGGVGNVRKAFGEIQNVEC